MLVVRSTKVPEAVLAAGALKLVVRAGAGYNTIDVAAASRRGIYVSNCPGKNSVAVAELAFGLILALDRQIADNVIALREGRWNKSGFSKARGLFGRTLGLIGVGQIGREMIPRARAFGMPVAAWSRSLTAEGAKALGVEYKASPAEVAAAADIVSVHVALNAQTKGTDRRGVLCGDAAGRVLHQHVARRGGRSGGAGARRGGEGHSRRARRLRRGAGGRRGRIRRRDRQAHRRLRHAPHRRIHRAGAGGDRRRDGAHHPDVLADGQGAERGQPGADHAGDLRAGGAASGPAGRAGAVLDAVRAAGINVQEMENIIFEGAEAAVARIHLESSPGPEVLAQIRASSPHILEVGLIAL